MLQHLLPVDFWKGSSDSFARWHGLSPQHVWGGLKVLGPQMQTRQCCVWLRSLHPALGSQQAPQSSHLLSICGALRSLIWVTFRRRFPCWMSANSALRPFRSVFLKLGASVLICKGIGIWPSSDIAFAERQSAPSAARLFYRSSAFSAPFPGSSTHIPCSTISGHAHTTSVPGTVYPTADLEYTVLVVSRILFKHLGFHFCISHLIDPLTDSEWAYCGPSCFFAEADSGSGSWFCGRYGDFRWWPLYDLVVQGRTRKLRGNGAPKGGRIRKIRSQGSQSILVTMSSIYWVGGWLSKRMNDWIGSGRCKTLCELSQAYTCAQDTIMYRKELIPLHGSAQLSIHWLSQRAGPQSVQKGPCGPGKLGFQEDVKPHTVPDRGLGLENPCSSQQSGAI